MQGGRRVVGPVHVSRYVTRAVGPSATRTIYGPGPVVITYAATITPDAGLSEEGKVAATGALAVNPPANGAEGRKYLLTITAAGGAARTVTLAAGIAVLTGLSRTITVASGQTAYVGLRHDGAAWVLLASGVTG